MVEATAGSGLSEVATWVATVDAGGGELAGVAEMGAVEVVTPDAEVEPTVEVAT